MTKTIDLLTTEQLLNTRIKDLDLRLPHKYKKEISKLSKLLAKKNIIWRPHFWASDEWFSPDGIGGIAYSFTLCHPKLIKLENKYLGFCEGRSTHEFFKLLAHETGHAIDNAYRLRRKKVRQKLFGLSSKEYPRSYRPKTDSKDYVTYLNDFYAQAHPDEDWAETFAVWLTIKNSSSKYKKTKAQEKINYIDQVMSELKLDRNFKKSKNTYKDARNDTRTIRQYLEQKKENLKLNRSNFYTHRIPKKIISNEGVLASKFISMKQRDILNTTTKDKWITQKCLNELKDECKKKKYRLKYSYTKSEYFIKKLVEDNYEDFIRQGRTRVYM